VFKLITVMSLLASSLFAARMPVDDVIEGLRTKASHLEQLKALFQATTCTVEVPNNQVTLQAGALRDNAIVISISESLKGNYLAYSSAPKAHQLKNIMEMTVKHQVKRPMIISSSLQSATGELPFTHLLVKVVEIQMSKDILDPATLKPTAIYTPVGFSIPLELVKKGVKSASKELPNGGSVTVNCK